jgi:hypothetical protein
MSIAGGLSATKTGFDLIKSAVDLLKRETVDVHEVQARLIELQGLMLEARSALVDAEEENRTLRRSIEDDQRRQEIENDMDFQTDGGFYIRKSEASKGTIAYCPVCWKKGGRTIPMQLSDVGQYWCSVHNTNYTTSAYGGPHYD